MNKANKIVMSVLLMMQTAHAMEEKQKRPDSERKFAISEVAGEEGEARVLSSFSTSFRSRRSLRASTLERNREKLLASLHDFSSMNVLGEREREYVYCPNLKQDQMTIRDFYTLRGVSMKNALHEAIPTYEALIRYACCHQDETLLETVGKITLCLNNFVVTVADSCLESLRSRNFPPKSYKENPLEAMQEMADIFSALTHAKKQNNKEEVNLRKAFTEERVSRRSKILGQHARSLRPASAPSLHLSSPDSAEIQSPSSAPLISVAERPKALNVPDAPPADDEVTLV